MSGRAEFFLGIIAVATLATAIVQIGVLVAAGLLFRRIQKLTERVDAELRPIFASLQQVARDASRVSSLAAAQVERVDHLLSEMVQALEKALRAVQSILSTPLVEGAGWVGGVRAVLRMIRDLRGRRRRAADEEETLFI